MRLYALGLASLALLFSAAALFLRYPLTNNEAAQRIACVAGACSTEELAVHAYDQLLDGEPNTSPTLDYFVTMVRRNASGRSFAIVLGSTSAFDQVVFDSFRRFGFAACEVLAVLPENSRTAQAWFYYTRQHGSPHDLGLTWDWLLDHGYVDRKLAASYLDARPTAAENAPYPVQSSRQSDHQSKINDVCNSTAQRRR